MTKIFEETKKMYQSLVRFWIYAFSILTRLSPFYLELKVTLRDPKPWDIIISQHALSGSSDLLMLACMIHVHLQKS
jgi:hypothetical protein